MGFTKNQLRDFVSLIEAGQGAPAAALQQLFPAMLKQVNEDVKVLAERLNLIQSNDEDEIRALAKSIVESYPDKVTAYRKGKKGLLGFFMGELMKQSRGKANPKTANGIIKAFLEE